MQLSRLGITDFFGKVTPIFGRQGMTFGELRFPKVINFYIHPPRILDHSSDGHILEISGLDELADVSPAQVGLQ